MKTKTTITIALMILLSLLQTNNYAQQDSSSESVRKYWDKVNKISTYYVKGTGITKKISDVEIDSIKHLFYHAISDDPIGYRISKDNERDSLDNILKENHYNSNLIAPRVNSLKTIYNFIKKKYGKNFFEILQCPYFLRVKLIRDSLSKFIPTDPKGFRTWQGNLICKVEDVIKGEKFFKIGQEITISYLVFWMSDSKTPFKIGESYFMPLRPWGTNKVYKKLTLHFFPDNNFATYPINNEIVSTPGNYFGIGETTDWETFKNNFIRKYILN